MIPRAARRLQGWSVEQRAEQPPPDETEPFAAPFDAEKAVCTDPEAKRMLLRVINDSPTFGGSVKAFNHKIRELLTKVQEHESQPRLAKSGQQATQCTFYFLLAGKVKEFSSGLPKFQDLLARGKQEGQTYLVKKTLTLQDAMDGSHIAECVAISHR